jgi:hypothetical protein
MRNTDPLRVHMPWRSLRNLLCSGSSSRYKSRMICINVCRLDLNQTLGIFRRRTESFAQQFGDNLDNLGMQPRESLKFLFSTKVRVGDTDDKQMTSDLTVLVQL